MEAISSVTTAEQPQFFEDNGFLILPGFFSKDVVRAAKDHLDALWERRAEQPNIVVDCYFTRPNASRTLFRKADADVRNYPYKLLDLHLEDPFIRDIGTDPRLVSVLRELLSANPLVCNSLLFEWGSQQEAHFDTFFMPSETKNKMAASWIAFDDVTETNGPLYYYPKSHLIEPYVFSNGRINAILAELKTGAAAHIERIVEEHGLKQERFLPKAGDVLIWHAQLLHGGSPIIDPRQTRCSLVTHYWTEIDFPNVEQRLDLGDQRWILRRPHQPVVDDEILAEVAAFLKTVEVSDEMRASVPETFDPVMYLARNQDVLRVNLDPWTHYACYGKREGRNW